MHHPAVG